MSRPKDIGTAAETAAVRALRTLGFPHAERRALAGQHDQGDITGTPGICWEVKGGQQTKRPRPSDLTIAQWMIETEVERINARADVGVLVLQRHGFGPANAHLWWAYLPAVWVPRLLLGDFKILHYEHTVEDSDILRAPVRLHLATACTMLRRAGYGQPLSELEAATG